MGKSKPRNRVKNRTDPTGKPKPPADPELAAIREQRILPVLKDLQSAELKTRSSAARVITNIIEDSKCRKLLLREQIVRILLEQTLSDSSLDTRADGWGILRNLALEEKADFCVHLYRQDILTAIEGVVKTIVQTLESQAPPVSKLPIAQQELLWSLTSSVLSLLISLSEAQDEIVEAISKLPTIINFLFGLLALKDAPSGVKNKALSCLASLTEDNKELSQTIADNGDWLKGLIAMTDGPSITAVHACGVLHNIFGSMQWFDHNTPVEGASDAMLIPALVRSLEQPKSNGTNGNVEHSSPDQILQLALEITASIATCLQEALEHGNRHEKEFEGFADDEPTNGEDVDEMEANGDADEDLAGEDGEMNDDEIEEDMDMVLGDGSEDDHVSPSEQVTLDRLVRNAAPKILTLARPTGDEQSPIQSYALAALNNIAWTISSIDFSTSHLDSLHKFWASLSQQLWDEIITPVLASNTADIELASAITSLAWAVTRSVKGTTKLQPEEHRKFMALYQASKGLPKPPTNAKPAEEDADSFQGLGVKCIGVLGSLALHPAPFELNREIGIFLLTVLSSLPETPAADAVEALNQLFDIYGDKSYAFDKPVFWGDNFYTHLEEVGPKVKKMSKGIDKRFFGELRARADEAVLNLQRFLQYKRKESKSKDEDGEEGNDEELSLPVR